MRKIILTIVASIIVSLLTFLGVYKFLPLGWLDTENTNLGSTITTIAGSDTLSASRSVINTNFQNLNSDKIQSGDSVAALTITALTSSGLTLNGIITQTTSATSTFVGGISTARLEATATSTMAGIMLSSGCFRTSSGTCLTPGGSGTVTSVGVSSSGSITVGSTPVTTSGTITVDLAMGNSNTWTALQAFNYSATTTLSGGLRTSIGLEGAYVEAGRILFGSGSATTSLRYDDDGNGQITVGTSSPVVGFDSFKHLFGITIPNPGTASTTIILPVKNYPFTAKYLVCVVNGATNAIVRLKDASGNVTNSITCTQTSTSTEQTLTSNNTFTKYEGVDLEIVSTSGNPNQLNVTVIGSQTVQ